ncbi:fungal-specific transcription factor domain-containing protein [Talaromyces proteolyticus]|uniref:Fungal-specific transcription factor domain-containing protein n=1 Tax=Talaromyces proteolyticus TaxID=1131652 RepID=A0AAD4Q5J2_9EURO|nr:fungal-specific transcription factor domain-containing protein [Talaromyces proteolyticus]KAH8704226.1 fungal-specific transcription factor domain-containing protein [Talaromyces proteolyticus]
MVEGTTSRDRSNQQDVARNARPTKGRRNPYTQIACEECRRRKIKCNGDKPCRRCGNLKLNCHYFANIKAPEQIVLSHSEDRDVAALKLQISSLQVELQSVLAQVRLSKHGRSPGSDDANSPPESALKQSSSISISNTDANDTLRHRDCLYHGPASAVFPYDIVRNNLQSMGIMDSPASASNALEFYSANELKTTQKEQDPLRLLSRGEALHLCELFAEEANIMYPFLDMDKLKSQIEIIFSNTHSKVTIPTQKYEGLSVDELDVVILMLAVSLVIESGGESEVGRSLFLFTKDRLKNKIWSPITLTGIKSLVLAGRYYFYSYEDERQAWRTIGIAARQCLELGLHRTEAYSTMSPEDADSARILFWSIFTLDRRWSFGTGLPFAIQEEDIDSSLPEPDATCFYLKTMIPYCRIGSRVWFSGLGTGNLSKLRADSMKQLDLQVLEWQKHIPEILQCPNPYSTDSDKRPGLRNLQVQIYVRTNIMRVLVYRPVLYSAQNIAENKKLADLCLYLAKDTIRVLYQMNKINGIYDTRQALFSFFILSSFAVILLACFHAPADFCACVQEEVSMALELIRGLDAKSRVAKRLWKVIEDLRDVGEGLGIFFPPKTSGQQGKDHAAPEVHESLGSHQPPALVFRGDEMPATGLQMSDELTGLLEATGVYNFPPAGSVEEDHSSLSSHSNKQSDINQASVRGWGNVDELFEIMDPLFQNS